MTDPIIDEDELPGEHIDLGQNVPAEIVQQMKINAGQVIALLWSAWGIEGVYTEPERLNNGIDMVRLRQAYKDAQLSIELKLLNPAL